MNLHTMKKTITILTLILTFSTTISLGQELRKGATKEEAIAFINKYDKYIEHYIVFDEKYKVSGPNRISLLDWGGGHMFYVDGWTSDGKHSNARFYIKNLEAARCCKTPGKIDLFTVTNRDVSIRTEKGSIEKKGSQNGIDLFVTNRKMLDEILYAFQRLAYYSKLERE